MDGWSQLPGRAQSIESPSVVSQSCFQKYSPVPVKENTHKTNAPVCPTLLSQVTFLAHLHESIRELRTDPKHSACFGGPWACWDRGEHAEKPLCASQLLCFPGVISETRVFLYKKTHPQNHEVTVVGWDHSRLLGLGFSLSCQGFALNNLYSLCACEDNTVARSCCSVLISSGSGIPTHPALCCRDMSLPAGNVLKKKPFPHCFFLLLSSRYLFSPQYCKLTPMLGGIMSFPCRRAAEAAGPRRCMRGVEISWCGMDFADCHPSRFLMKFC